MTLVSPVGVFQIAVRIHLRKASVWRISFFEKVFAGTALSWLEVTFRTRLDKSLLLWFHSCFEKVVGYLNPAFRPRHWSWFVLQILSKGEILRFRWRSIWILVLAKPTRSFSRRDSWLWWNSAVIIARGIPIHMYSSILSFIHKHLYYLRVFCNRIHQFIYLNRVHLLAGSVY